MYVFLCRTIYVIDLIQSKSVKNGGWKKQVLTNLCVKMCWGEGKGEKGGLVICAVYIYQVGEAVLTHIVHITCLCIWLISEFSRFCPMKCLPCLGPHGASASRLSYVNVLSCLLSLLKWSSGGQHIVIASHGYHIHCTSNFQYLLQCSQEKRGSGRDKNAGFVMQIRKKLRSDSSMWSVAKKHLLWKSHAKA